MEFVLFPYFMHEYLNYKYLWLVFFFLENNLRNRFLIEDDWFLVPLSYSFYCILVFLCRSVLMVEEIGCTPRPWQNCKNRYLVTLLIMKTTFNTVHFHSMVCTTILEVFRVWYYLFFIVLLLVSETLTRHCAW